MISYFTLNVTALLRHLSDIPLLKNKGVLYTFWFKLYCIEVLPFLRHTKAILLLCIDSQVTSACDFEVDFNREKVYFATYVLFFVLQFLLSVCRNLIHLQMRIYHLKSLKSEDLRSVIKKNKTENYSVTMWQAS